jgi:hypothetical protein
VDSDNGPVARDAADHAVRLEVAVLSCQ